MSRKYVTVILSSSGLTSTSTDFSIYTNDNKYAYPIANNITNFQLTATTTPFNLLVPQAATKVMILDKNNGKKTYADITTNNLCDTCDFGFDYYPTATVGRLYAGKLTGTCQSNFGNYKINWYGPNSSTNVAYTSGSGTSFNYSFTHPLTGATGLFALAGTYFPVIDKVKIGDVSFSQSGNTLYSNNPVPALLTCFESVSINVDAFKCDNGDSSNLPQYEHRVKFTAVGSGDSPRPLNSTFLLSAGTKYFAWKFQGESVPDKLKLTYYGSAYNYTPIVLEYWEVGQQVLNNNYNFNAFPKTSRTIAYMAKLTCLTGLTINANDTIIMDVIPNTSNPSTNWDFYFGCYNDNIDCNLNTGTTRPYKLIGSTLSSITFTCGVSIKGKFSGVPYTSTTQYDLFNFCGGYYITPLIDGNGVSTLEGTPLLYFSQITCNYSNSYWKNEGDNYCLPNASYNITYQKTVGNFKMTTNNPSYITYTFNDYNTNIKPRISTYSADSSNINYYNYFVVQYPSSTGSQVCGDGTNRKEIYIHQSSVITTGQTGSDYWINYTMPTISSGMTFTTCDLNCSQTLSNQIFYVNYYSTGTTFNDNRTTNTAARYRYPNQSFSRSSSATTLNNNTYIIDSYIDIHEFQNETVPASGSSNTLIPSLSGVSCPNFYDYFYRGSSDYYRKYNAQYDFRLTNQSNLSDFQIYTNTTIETSVESFPAVWKLVYTFSGGTVHYSDPNYII